MCDGSIIVPGIYLLGYCIVILLAGVIPRGESSKTLLRSEDRDQRTTNRTTGNIKKSNTIVASSDNTTTRVLYHGGPPFDVLWFGWNGVSQTSEWEYDYLRELFPENYFRHTNSSTAPSVTTCRRKKETELIQTKYLGMEAPSLFGYWLGYKPAKKAGTSVAPKLRVVIHLGDEDMGMKPDKLSCVDLFPHVALSLRQYAIPSSVRSSLEASAGGGGDDTVLQIPLGYMVGYLRDDNKDQPPAHTSVQYAQWSLARNSSARRMKWSFVGGLHGAGKTEREHAIKVFSGWSPHLTSNQVPPNKLRHVYNDSLFVVSGRGHVTLDCFRLYEAAIAGAIPIVVGPASETNQVFEFNGEKPPFLFAKSWEEALKIATKMSFSDIDNKRAELVRWYVSRIHTIKRKIHRVFGLPP